jgi:hypothetical protein
MKFRTLGAPFFPSVFLDRNLLVIRAEFDATAASANPQEPITALVFSIWLLAV